LLKVVQEAVSWNGDKQPYYEIMWEREVYLDERVEQAWAGADTRGDLGQISMALRDVLSALKAWSKEKFGSVRKDLENMRKKLVDLQAADIDQSTIREAIREMNELLYKEEMMWL
jgi:Holliday junction resolvase RusA-like endonuclease